MFILAIESSCDETAAAVLEMSEDTRKILSNTVYTQIATHALYGGVVPEIASREHIKKISAVVSEAFSKSGKKPSDIDAVAVTYAPGLIGSLLVGVSFAKSLAFSLDVPLIPVDHIKGHTAAAYLAYPELEAPFLALIVSGGHTSIYNVRTPTDFEEIGATRDDAAGEAFDKVGRLMGLPYPGGAAMDKLAAEGFAERKNRKCLYKFPSPAIADDTLDFSFSGLKTFAVNTIHTERQKRLLSDKDALPDEIRREIASGFTEAVVSGICQKLEKALVEVNAEKLVLAGGVAANSHLRLGVEKIASKHKVKVYIPPVSLCGDNGAMIGAQGYYEYLAGVRADTSLNAFASDEAALWAKEEGKDGITRKEAI